MRMPKPLLDAVKETGEAARHPLHAVHREVLEREISRAEKPR